MTETILASARGTGKSMREAERQQQQHKQDRQGADARILGQIMAAQNVLFSLPGIIRILPRKVTAIVAIE